jgi:hypothetical protein
MQAMDMIDESEDDMAPLITALEKARERAERMTKIRMANESEALEIAGMAIAMKDTVDSANNAVEETLHAIKKREEQLRRLTASKQAIDEEELRLSQGDALASVDSPMSSDAASVGLSHARFMLILCPSALSLHCKRPHVLLYNHELWMQVCVQHIVRYLGHR